MLGHYAQGIIYCWRGQRYKIKVEQKVKFAKSAINSYLIVTETLNLIHVLVYEKPHHI